MPEKLFYIRSGNRISGPFPQQQILRLKEKRLLEPDSLISENKVAWKKLDDLSEPQYVETSTIPLVESAELQTIPISQESKEADSTPAAPLQSAPETETETIEQTFEQPETIEEAAEPQLIPDPVCATIGLCWNAPNRLKTLLLIQKASETCGTAKRDQNVLYSFITVFGLILLLCVATFLCTVLLSGIHVALWITCGILFLGGTLLLFLSNLLLAMIANLKKILAPFFLAMQFLCIATIVFAAGTPLWGLYLAGPENCPVWVQISTWSFSGCALLFGMFNLLRGYIAGCRNIFDFRTGATVLFSFLLALQTLAIFPAGFLLFGFVQKINFL